MRSSPRVNRFIANMGAVAMTLSIVAANAANLQTETATIEAWRAQRIASLTSPTGWLTLVGLYWLREGENSFGSAPSNRLVLKHTAMPPTLGAFVMRNGRVQFVADAHAAVLHDGKRVGAIEMTPDTSAEPTTLDAGSLQFFVIERAGKLGVRVRDTQHRLRTHFKGLDYFPIDPKWAIDAKFEPYLPVKHIDIVNILGLTESLISPGAIVINKAGREWRLDTLLEEPDAKELFVMFADATSGRETYGAGRFLYIDLPHDNHVLVDFNKAYNPPCAFNEFATCPLPPRQNRLTLRVDAGEKKYSVAH